MPESLIIRRPARPAGQVEGDVNRVAQDQQARLRPGPGPLPQLAPIPASIGAADWGEMAASS